MIDRERVIALYKELISIPSVVGDEKNLALFLETRLKESILIQSLSIQADLAVVGECHFNPFALGFRGRCCLEIL